MKMWGIKCPLCRDVVYSFHPKGLKYCSCGAVALDQGKDYQMVSWSPSVRKEEIEYLEVEDVNRK